MSPKYVARGKLIAKQLVDMKKIFLMGAFVLSILLSSCQTDDKDNYTRLVSVKSVPAGAVIVVDGFKLGKAPMTISVETNETGNFVRKTVVTAIPQRDGLHTHVKTFPAYLATAPEKSIVPESITFYMERNPSDSGAVVLDAED